MIKKIVFSIVTMVSLTFISCGGDDTEQQPTGTITLNVLNLEELEGDYSYQGWLITPNGSVSTGKLSSVTFPQTFTAYQSDIDDATEFVLSIESSGSNNSTPSNTKILSGVFSGNAASLTINSTIGNYTDASGVFVLATPTDNNTNTTNNENGIWFMNPTTEKAGLTLPTLTTSSGWKYEGWVIADDGTAVSTGTFLNPDEADDFSPFSGNQTAPNFPGEDFLNSTVAPDGVTFPLDVREKKVVISIEPSPDNSSLPFFIKPLQGTAGNDVTPSLNQLQLNNASFPLGTVSKS